MARRTPTRTNQNQPGPLKTCRVLCLFFGPSCKILATKPNISDVRTVALDACISFHVTSTGPRQARFGMQLCFIFIVMSSSRNIFVCNLNQHEKVCKYFFNINNVNPYFSSVEKISGTLCFKNRCKKVQPRRLYCFARNILGKNVTSIHRHPHLHLCNVISITLYKLSTALVQY